MKYLKRFNEGIFDIFKKKKKEYNFLTDIDNAKDYQIEIENLFLIRLEKYNMVEKADWRFDYQSGPDIIYSLNSFHHTNRTGLRIACKIYTNENQPLAEITDKMSVYTDLCADIKKITDSLNKIGIATCGSTAFGEEEADAFDFYALQDYREIIVDIENFNDFKSGKHIYFKKLKKELGERRAKQSKLMIPQ